VKAALARGKDTFERNHRAPPAPATPQRDTDPRFGSPARGLRPGAELQDQVVLVLGAQHHDHLVPELPDLGADDFKHLLLCAGVLHPLSRLAQRQQEALAAQRLFSGAAQRLFRLLALSDIPDDRKKGLLPA